MPKYTNAVEDHVEGVLYYKIPENSDAKEAIHKIVKIVNRHDVGSVSDEKYPFSREVIFSHQGLEIPIRAGANPELLCEKYDDLRYQAQKKTPATDAQEKLQPDKDDLYKYGLHYKVPEGVADKHIKNLIADAFCMAVSLSHPIMFEHNNIKMPIPDELNSDIYFRRYEKLKAEKEMPVIPKDEKALLAGIVLEPTVKTQLGVKPLGVA